MKVAQAIEERKEGVASPIRAGVKNRYYILAGAQKQSYWDSRFLCTEGR